MSDHVSATVEAFSRALQDISAEWITRQRNARRLLKPDALERIVPAKLLGEGLAKLLDDLSKPERPLVLFFDRNGGGDGARAAAGLFPALGERWRGVSFVHVSFATPTQGLGALVRSVLTHAGAEHGVDVHVVAFQRPAEGIGMTTYELDDVVKACDLVLTFATGGSAGLISPRVSVGTDLLVSRSHLSVLSFPDPESLVGDLAGYAGLIEKEPTIDGIRFWVQIKADGEYQDLGTTVLGEGGDAEDRLWVLIDNARRQPFRILMEPMRNGLPGGDPLVCPCRTVIESEIGLSAQVIRVVPAGSCLVGVVRGKTTMI